MPWKPEATTLPYNYNMAGSIAEHREMTPEGSALGLSILKCFLCVLEKRLYLQGDAPP